MEQTTSRHTEVNGTPVKRPAGQRFASVGTPVGSPGEPRHRDPRARAPLPATLGAAVFGLTAFVAVAADLATKALATAALQRHRPVEVVGEWVRLTLGYNEGIAFGFFATEGLGVLLLTGLVVFALAVWAVIALRDPATPRWTPLSLGLVLGGGAANFLDRLADGRVTDFLDLGLGLHRWPTFNLADVCIVVGVGLLVLGSFRSAPRRGERTPNGPPAP